MVRVIVINGQGTSGKDTFIDLFTEVSGIPVFRFSSVDEVKAHAIALGWDGKKDAKGRRFLSDLKDAMTRYNDAPFVYMFNQIKKVCGSYEDAFIFFHIREPKEIERMVKSFNATTILIERTVSAQISFTNHADNGVYDYTYDYFVKNNGTIPELKKSAETIFHDLISGGVRSASVKANL